MNRPLVSIIIPARNAQPYIAEAIESVLAQSVSNWELVVVDNGSTDKTADIARSYLDKRIRVVVENKVGVSNARNRGLAEILGEYFCFLDADDRLPPLSIEIRLNLFNQNPEIEIADGWMEHWDKNFSKINWIWKPSFKGNPYIEFASLNESCFGGFHGMIRKIPGKKYFFEQQWSHSEDVAFLLSISKSALYDFVPSSIYEVRRGHQSAMSNLNGLEDGYEKFLLHIQSLDGLPANHFNHTRKKIRMIMTKTYLKKGKIFSAIHCWLKFSFIK